VKYTSLRLTLWWSFLTALLVGNKIFEDLKVDLENILIPLAVQWKADIFFGSLA
jgi:hypothetical protein